MQDLIVEFGIQTPPTSLRKADEHDTVTSLIRWLPTAYIGVSRYLRTLREKGHDVHVLVHGDTLSTLVGAIAGRRRRTRVVHIESGLSSGRLFDPFPEEFVRRLVFRLTNLALCPNATASEFMLRNYRARVMDTGGNTIIDAVKLTGAAEIRPDPQKPYVVVSLHRFQNLYDRGRLRELVDLIERISSFMPVKFVLHPATRKRLRKAGLKDRLNEASGVTLLPRLGYKDFLCLTAGSACVLTDGGSNQEELSALGIPTIVMRDRTERADGLGDNAMMEADVPEGLIEYLRSGSYSLLRQAPTMLSAAGPSTRIASELDIRAYGDGGSVAP